MRISDWSSDVCSSDLSAQTGSVRTDRLYRRFGYLDLARRADRAIDQPRPHHPPKDQDPRHRQRGRQQVKVDIAEHLDQPAGTRRSEEHTSELQSLMRISYAVFCLKKKNTNITK